VQQAARGRAESAHRRRRRRPRAAAVADGSLLTLADEKGRTVLVPGDRIAYVEIGVSERGRIGFGAG
jgi:hypothetical protein